MSWLTKLLPPRIKSNPGVRKTPVPEGLWIKCPSCEAVLYRTDLEKNLLVCPKYGHHQRVGARELVCGLQVALGLDRLGASIVCRARRFGVVRARCPSDGPRPEGEGTRDEAARGEGDDHEPTLPRPRGDGC